MQGLSNAEVGEAESVGDFHCNLCNRMTEHRICFSRSISGNDVLGDEVGSEIFWNDTYMVVSCCGCKVYSFVHRHWFSEHTDGTGRPEVSEDLYPHRMSRKTPEWMHNALDRLILPDQMASLLQEIYAALHQNLLALASMGARSLIEHIMVDKVGDRGGFAANMSAFIDQGYIGTEQRAQLVAALEVGHAVTHRGYLPNRSDLETVLDIAESLIATLYVHSRRTMAFHERIPRRMRPPSRGH